MKILSILIVGIVMSHFAVSKARGRNSARLEIIKVDSIEGYFVFTTHNEAGVKSTILGEKEVIRECQPFKRYIISDSIHKEILLKQGSDYLPAWPYIGFIDSVSIRDSNDMVKLISNCNAFTDR